MSFKLCSKSVFKLKWNNDKFPRGPTTMPSFVLFFSFSQGTEERDETSKFYLNCFREHRKNLGENLRKIRKPSGKLRTQNLSQPVAVDSPLIIIRGIPLPTPSLFLESLIDCVTIYVKQFMLHLNSVIFKNWFFFFFFVRPPIKRGII